MKEAFDSEAALVRAFLDTLNHRHGQGKDWTVYPETGGWDLLLVHKDGYQLGIEAKLTLNSKVVAQALTGAHSYWARSGPDYRAVLVPRGGRQRHIEAICAAIGIGVITLRNDDSRGLQWLDLPNENSGYDTWANWCPAERCPLPDYIPDVQAGVPSPIKLTEWKIKAIRLLIVLERRGYVTRDDMKRIHISPTRWTDTFYGFLRREGKGYVRCDATPDLRAQHPTVYAQIEEAADTWAQTMGLSLRDEEQGVLI